MRLVLSRRSTADLELIGDYIASDNPRRAIIFLQELRKACSELCDRPHRFPVLEGFETQVYRRRPYGNYAIVYQVQHDVVLVVRILNSAMDLASALGD